MGADTGIVWFLRSTEEDLGNVRLVSLEGRVSQASASDLAGALAAPQKNGCQAVVVDLSGVDYINGAGLQVFETAAARLSTLGSELVICGLRPAVQAVFDLAGSIPNLTTELSRDSALRRFERTGT